MPKGSALRDTDITEVAIDVILSTAYNEKLTAKAIDKIKLGPQIDIEMMAVIKKGDTNISNPKLKRMLDSQVARAEEHSTKVLDANHDDSHRDEHSIASFSRGIQAREANSRFAYKSRKLQLINDLSQLLDEQEVIKNRLNEPPKKASSLKKKLISHNESIADKRSKSNLIDFVTDLRVNQVSTADLVNLMNQPATRKKHARSDLPLLANLNDYERFKNHSTASYQIQSERISLHRDQDRSERIVPRLSKVSDINKLCAINLRHESKDASPLASPVHKDRLKYKKSAPGKNSAFANVFTHHHHQEFSSLQPNFEKLDDLIEVEKLILDDFRESDVLSQINHEIIYPRTQDISQANISSTVIKATGDQSLRSMADVIHANDSTWSANCLHHDQTSARNVSQIVSKVSLRSRWQHVIRDQLNNAVKLGLNNHFNMRVKAEGSLTDKPEFIAIELTKRKERPVDMTRSSAIM